ncbi:MAG: hypothetical protein PHI42_08520 [Paludibacteraceae bacterium]|nr:hypothetical protein [Paludibacteraceae bacterium]
MSIKVVSNFNRKSADKWTVKGLPPIDKTLKECLTDLQKYINDTVDEYLGTTVYADLTVAEWIYKETVTTAEEEEYVKVNLFAAKKSFNNIVNEIASMKGGLTFNNIKLYRQLIYDFLHDINSFITYYRRKTDPKFVFLTGGKNYLTSSFETFMVARGLFYNSLIKDNPLPYKESQGMVSMTLRQSIEIKTKRIFGIYKINKVRRRAPDYGFKRLFDFIEANKADIAYNLVDFEILKHIYKWSCAYIHNGEISYLWQTENAFNYLKTYFAPGTHTGSKTTTRSVFGAFKLSNFNSLKTKLNTFIGADYSVEYLPDSQVEAIIVSH